MLFIFLFLLCVLAGAETICTTRRVTVTGQVGCGDHALKNVKVELLERDLFNDELLATQVTDANGRFMITGEDCEIGGIEPYVKVYHSCDDGVVNPRCIVTDEFDVPQDAIDSTYKMGIVSLNIPRKGHHKDCTLNRVP